MSRTRDEALEREGPFLNPSLTRRRVFLFAAIGKSKYVAEVHEPPLRKGSEPLAGMPSALFRVRVAPPDEGSGQHDDEHKEQRFLKAQHPEVPGEVHEEPQNTQDDP